MERDLRDILTAALAAADPRLAVRRVLRVEDGRILVRGQGVETRRVVVLAVGKAAGAMAREAEDHLGAFISGGLVVTKQGYDVPLTALDTLVAGHPHPNAASVEAARRVTDLARSVGEGDLLLALVSGGASALLADAAGGIDLDTLAQLNEALLRSGATIHEINAVRKHISTLKGGGLARLAAPATVVTLLLSDVVGDDPSAIGSSPTVPDPTTLADVSAILRRYRRFRWVLLMCLKAVRFEHSLASIPCPFQGPGLSNRPKTPGSTRLT